MDNHNLQKKIDMIDHIEIVHPPGPCGIAFKPRGGCFYFLVIKHKKNLLSMKLIIFFYALSINTCEEENWSAFFRFYQNLSGTKRHFYCYVMKCMYDLILYLK